MTTELYLIRHAESLMNTRPEIVGGRSNETPLTAKGIDQAKNLGRCLRRKGIVPTAVYASPAVRTRSTAEYALATLQIPVTPVLEDSIQELAQGEWVGELRSTIYTPSVLEQIAQEGKDFKAVGGESMNEVGARVLNWINSDLDPTTDEYGNRRIFVFMHGLAIRCVASTLEDWSHTQTYETPTDNTSVTLLTDASGEWQVSYLGRAPEDL